jgi:hypothetical protein
MRVILALAAVTASVTVLGWIALRDPKRMRSHESAVALRAPLTSRQRRLLALGALAPGLLLMLSGWWSSAIMWIGGTVTLAWLWVIWLSRTRSV